MTALYRIVTFERNGKDIFQEWLKSLRDITAKKAINRAVLRMADGNFGDHKFCRDGVSELRIHVGAGYRVYYSVSGNEIIVLLCGGDKRTQSKDIDKAVEYLQNFKEENNYE